MWNCYNKRVISHVKLWHCKTFVSPEDLCASEKRKTVDLYTATNKSTDAARDSMDTSTEWTATDSLKNNSIQSNQTSRLSDQKKPRKTYKN